MTHYDKKVHLVGQVYSEIMNKRSVKNIKKIKGNTQFVKVVLSKVSLQFLPIFDIIGKLVTSSVTFAKISMFSKVDQMYLLLYWVTYYLYGHLKM